MDEQNGFDQQAEPVGPEIDDSGNPTEAAPEQGDKPKAPAGREMLIQLQQMIDTIAYQAAPVVREVGAKAAELAAIAGSKAGPLAHKAADATEQFGQRVAARSTAMAADLRKPREDGEAASAGTSDAPGDAGTAGTAGSDEPFGGGEPYTGGDTFDSENTTDRGETGQPWSTEPGPGESTEQF
jgi:hypothetical protein